MYQEKSLTEKKKYNSIGLNKCYYRLDLNYYNKKINK